MTGPLETEWGECGSGAETGEEELGRINRMRLSTNQMLLGVLKEGQGDGESKQRRELGREGMGGGRDMGRKSRVVSPCLFPPAEA